MPYDKLLSPLCIRNKIIKNRMVSTASTPHFLQGREKAPGDKVIRHFANRAKNGASIVTINHFHQDMMPIPGRNIDIPPNHFNLFDYEDATAQNYFCQLIDNIHLYGSLACAYIMPDESWLQDENEHSMMGPPPGKPGEGPQGGPDGEKPMGPPPGIKVEDVSQEMIQRYIQKAAREAGELAQLGFDIISVHTSYRRSPHTQFLSPVTNHRRDEYGGQSLETRSKFTLDLYKKIREAVGNNVILEIVMSVDEEAVEGYTLDDTVEFCRLADGLIDIIHLRNGEMDPQHPIGFTSTEREPVPLLKKMGEVAHRVHGLGLKEYVLVSSGFQNPDIAQQALLDGDADLIGFARAWINNPNFGSYILEDHPDRIVPCIRCNKCHIPNGKDKWRSVCSVNPMMGLEEQEEYLDRPSDHSYRCAVIGGGPAGMEFARVARERGHSVDLYEAGNELGGNLKHANYPSFKWPLRQFKEFLIREMGRLGVEVYLNRNPKPEYLKAKNYDVIILAMGSKPLRPAIPGADLPQVDFASTIYGREDTLADTVTVIGGGEIGVETALYLCELGKKVHVLEMQGELIADAPHAHYKNMVRDYWTKEKNFSYECGVRVTEIQEDGVCYIDEQGNEKKQASGSVLLSVGAKPLTEEAMKYGNLAPRTFAIGDVSQVANVQRAMRSAYGIAMSL